MSPTPVRAVELAGQIDKVNGICPTRTFALENNTVYTTGATSFAGGACSDLKNKKRVAMRGYLLSDGRVRADRIEFYGDNE